METKIPETDSASLGPLAERLISYGIDPGFMPSDDKLVDVWLALHRTMQNEMVAMDRLSSTQQLYFILTSQLLERAKQYGNLEPSRT